MNAVLIAAGVWGLAATAVALSSKYAIHRFFVLYVLLPSAIVILIALGYTYGVWAVVVAMVAIGSVLRWPLYYIGRLAWARLRGKPFELPDFKDDE